MLNNNKNTNTHKLTQEQQRSLSAILPFYSCSLDNCQINPIGNGLINDTYLVEAPQLSPSSFVLQRINHHVFPTPNEVVNNAELIHQHLQQKISNAAYPLQSIGHIKNTLNKPLTFCNNEYWRALDYIADSETVEHIETTTQAEMVARAFAQFSLGLSDLDANKLTETIPKFHHLNNRLEQLTRAQNNATLNKSVEVLNESQALLHFINSQQAFIKNIEQITTQLPLRVTHNDTKINNLLFSQTTGKALAVIDLDTCMPGFLMNDFGDLVRTCCPSIDENNTQLNAMHIRTDIFKAVARGYINTFKNTITPLEKESLVIGTQLIPFMLAIRFLTDHLNGNVYFQTQYPTQNLDRAKNQLHLFSLLQQKHDELLKML